MNISHLRAYSLCLVTGHPHVGCDKETVWLLKKNRILIAVLQPSDQHITRILSLLFHLH